MANETENGYCGKFLFVFDSQTCPFHRHVMKHETFFVLKGAVRMRTDDNEHILREGDLLVIASRHRPQLHRPWARPAAGSLHAFRAPGQTSSPTRRLAITG